MTFDLAKKRVQEVSVILTLKGTTMLLQKILMPKEQSLNPNV